MQRIEQLFDDYAAYHQTAGNRNFHRVGIPLIVFSLLGLLGHLHVFDAGAVPVDAAELLIVLSAIYYAVLEWRLAALMLSVTVLFYWAGRPLPMTIHWALFVLGWVLQFLGHSIYEKRKPAFLRNVVHLLVGPLWILNGIIPLIPQNHRN